MTMYVRTLVPMTLTISSQNEDDDVLLDGDHEVAVLPLWAAQRDEFQILWQDGKVEVALDPYFDDSSQIITEIPASELPGGNVDLTAYVPKDEGGRVPVSLMHTQLPLDDVLGTNGNQSVLRFLGSGTNAYNHLYVQNAASGPVSLGSLGDGDIGINFVPMGAGRVTVNNVPVLTGIQIINNQGGTLSVHGTDAGTLVTITSATPATVTVLSENEDYAPIGTTIEVAQLGTGQVSFGWSAGVTLHGNPGLKISGQYKTALLRKIASDVWLVTGSLSA